MYNVSGTLAYKLVHSMIYILMIQAYFLATFFYVPSHTATFAEFLRCMSDIHAYSLQHSNWSPGSQPGDTFLPVPPGCPPLTHDDDDLMDEGHNWLCV